MRLMVKCKSFNKCNIVRPSQKSVRNRECTDLLRASRLFGDNRMPLFIYLSFFPLLINPAVGKVHVSRGHRCELAGGISVERASAIPANRSFLRHASSRRVVIMRRDPLYRYSVHARKEDPRDFRMETSNSVD